MSIPTSVPKPACIVFDLGKVLLDFDYGIAARKLAGTRATAPDQIRQFIAESPLLLRYETGHLSRQQFYDQICAETGYCGDIEEFAGFFSDIFAPIPAMVELQGHLRAKGFPTYIFSNTNELAISHIRSNFPFFQNFDGYVLSYEHGSMKPDAALYEVVEKETGRSGAEILYLDDRPENILAGKERDWQVILQESPEKTRKIIAEMGLL